MIRFAIAGIIALITLVSYFSKSSNNPVTGEKQRVGSMTPDQEVALGLHATPQMMQQHGGEHPDPRVQQKVEEVGQRIVQNSDAAKSPYKYDFHVLSDAKTINAFALPGGQIFITAALLNKLDTDEHLAGVLAHEIGHVVGRHGAEHMAKQQLTAGLTGAAVVATYDPRNRSSQAAAAMAMMVGQLVNMKFGRNDELESDRLGVRFMGQAGYDPYAMIKVMEVLRDSRKGGAPPEFFSTHPNPDNRIAKIEEAIKLEFPQGVPQKR